MYRRTVINVARVPGTKRSDRVRALKSSGGPGFTFRSWHLSSHSTARKGTWTFSLSFPRTSEYNLKYWNATRDKAIARTTLRPRDRRRLLSCLGSWTYTGSLVCSSAMAAMNCKEQIRWCTCQAVRTTRWVALQQGTSICSHDCAMGRDRNVHKKATNNWKSLAARPMLTGRPLDLCGTEQRQPGYARLVGERSHANHRFPNT